MKQTRSEWLKSVELTMKMPNVTNIGLLMTLYDSTPPQDMPEHGVTVVFIELPNTKIELLAPLGDDSPIEGFLAKTGGGMHHVCYEVEDIVAARDKLAAAGARVLGGGEPKTGAHGKPVLFLHPKDFSGTLIELEQV